MSVGGIFLTSPYNRLCDSQNYSPNYSPQYRSSQRGPHFEVCPQDGKMNTFITVPVFLREVPTRGFLSLEHSFFLGRLVDGHRPGERSKITVASFGSPPLACNI